MSKGRAATSNCRSPPRSARRSICPERKSSSACPWASTISTMLRIDFVTIFPRMFDAFLAEGVVARGIKQGLIDARVWDLREFASDKHRSTDDEAYGGGPGMVMLAEPVLKCVEAVRDSRFEIRDSQGHESRISNLESHIIMTTPQ